MPRTNTTSRTTFSRSGIVTYSFPSTPDKATTTITLPPGSKWTSGLHWHETHTEYLRIMQGRARVTIAGTTGIYTPSDGVLIVPRYARHEWSRADVVVEEDEEEGRGREGGKEINGTGEEQDLIMREWTDPTDGEKEIFFRNLSSIILDSTADGTKAPNTFWLTWQLLVVFWTLDNFPVVVPVGDSTGLLGMMIESVFTYGALFVAAFVGRLVGLKAWYGEYTPAVLVEGKQIGKEKRL